MSHFTYKLIRSIYSNDLSPISFIYTAHDSGTMVAHKLIQAIKSKCENEEILDILHELPNPLKDPDEGQTTFSSIGPTFFIIY